jgi:hypothetical protein
VCNAYLFEVLATQDVELNGKDLAVDRRLEKLRRDLGPGFMGALNDPDTIEILLNADGTLWQEKLGGTMQPIGRMNAGIRSGISGGEGSRTPVLKTINPKVYMLSRSL